MLRITVDDKPESMTFQLEGTLVGPWVREVNECWQRMRTGRHGRPARFDLAGLTSIDSAGREFLAAIHADGVELHAYGCLMKAIVAEITGDPISDCGCAEE